MDITPHLTQHPHDAAWVAFYLKFVQEQRPVEATSELHHILPRAVFPEFADLNLHPWNGAVLTPADHLLAHYYLYRALPWEPSVAMAFRMMVGRAFFRLRRSGFDEKLLHEIAQAYAKAKAAGKPWSIKAKSRRSEQMKGIRPQHLTFVGLTHSAITRIKMSETRRKLFAERPEVVAHHADSRPRGTSHWTYGKSRDESTRSKISQSLTGHTQSQDTKDRRRASLDQFTFDQIPPEEHAIYEHALTLKTEVEAIQYRRPYAPSTRIYTILTGLIHIRLNRTGDVEPRYWAQAASWLRLSGHIPEQKGTPTCLTPRDASTRLGTGHKLLPGQKSAHALRVKGVNKGVTRAKQNFDAIPEEEHVSFRVAWAAGTSEALLSEQKKWPVRGRAYNILFGLRLLRTGEATGTNFERWRQGALWLALSGHEVPLTDEVARQELARLL